jgi:Ca-activated chloride channel homolog
MIRFDEALTRQRRYSFARHPVLFSIQLSLLLLVFGFAIGVYAQDDRDIDVVRVRTDLVTVPAFITDKRGRRIAHLSATDFELRDNGRPVTIEYFMTGTERVALVFALDASGSSRDVIGQQRELAVGLFLRFGQGSEIAVMRFADKAELVSGFSSEHANALRAFDFPSQANRRTAIFDAVANAILTFDLRPTDITERRIIVLISDGLDTISVTRPDKIVEEARNRGVSVYAIQVPLYSPRDGRLRPRAATKGFREIAEKSGGRFFMAGNDEPAFALKYAYDFSPIFQAIEDDLRGQYVLGYYPCETNRDGRFHRIDLRLALKDGRNLRVHLLRDGYNSKP